MHTISDALRMSCNSKNGTVADAATLVLSSANDAKSVNVPSVKNGQTSWVSSSFLVDDLLLYFYLKGGGKCRGLW